MHTMAHKIAMDNVNNLGFTLFQSKSDDNKKNTSMVGPRQGYFQTKNFRFKFENLYL